MSFFFEGGEEFILEEAQIDSEARRFMGDWGGYTINFLYFPKSFYLFFGK